jgi:ADP-ribosylglycohydrolase
MKHKNVLKLRTTILKALKAHRLSQLQFTAIRNAVSLGGDSDTLACITGSIAEPFYGGVPAEIERQVIERLPGELVDIMVKFSERYEQN